MVDFGIENDIAIMHDACYAEVTFDDYIAPSILEVDRAMEIAIEYHSFSKSFNMTQTTLQTIGTLNQKGCQFTGKQ